MVMYGNRLMIELCSHGEPLNCLSQ